MRSARRRTLVGATLVALIALTLYHMTLVPGMDLGDSAAFQVGAGTKLLTPRQGYPLYFAITAVTVKIAPDDPARAVNLVSAVCGAIATGILTIFVADLTGSVLAGVFSGLLFASSYTFWSQSVIAEVYALHMICVGLTLVALRAWAGKPSTARLGVAFGVYALSFGNHLSMILLAPAIVAFIAAAHPHGWRGLFEWRTISVALITATLGASQYLWNVAGMLAMPEVPASGPDLLKAFWFDVTKTDWRESMVLGTPAVMLRDRTAMYWFDVRQQFGVAGIVASVVGVLWLARRSRRDAVLLVTAFMANWLFAFTYNVGDVHVFFLPSHLILAAAAGCGIAAGAQAIAGRSSRLLVTCSTVALAYPGWRIYDTFPAVDRSGDRRAEQVLGALTHGLSADRAIFGADLNWQLQNALSYFATYRHPNLQYFRTADRMIGFPFLVDANLESGRQIYLSSDARRRVIGAFGSLYSIDPDPSVVVTRVSDLAAALPANTPYVICFLTPARDRPIDSAVPRFLLSILTGDERADVSLSGYAAIAGLKGSPPVLRRVTTEPFRASAELAGRRVIVRMDSWLAYDTIRRADFGHVILDHHPALGIDRGISFVAWPPNGGPVVAYESSLYAPQPRFVLHPGSGE